MELYDEVVEVKKKPREVQQSSAKPGPSRPAVLEQISDSERTTTKRPTSSLPRKSVKTTEKVTSESESSDTATEDNKEFSAEDFDYRQWEKNPNVIHFFVEIPGARKLYIYLFFSGFLLFFADTERFNGVVSIHCEVNLKKNCFLLNFVKFC